MKFNFTPIWQSLISPPISAEIRALGTSARAVWQLGLPI